MVMELAAAPRGTAVVTLYRALRARRVSGMEPPLDKLEKATSEQEHTVNVDRLVLEYRLAVADRPLWHLAQDVQTQAFIYSNIVEKLKEGQAASNIRQLFDELGLVPEDLPNPDGRRLLESCMRKLTKYRDCLISLATKHGRELLRELGMQNRSPASL